MPALLGQVLALNQLLLTQAASDQGSAADVHAVGEVAAGHTGAVAAKAFELFGFHVGPLLHHCLRSSTPVLVALAVGWQCFYR